MSDGLKIVVGADTSEAEKALKGLSGPLDNLAAKTKKAGAALSQLPIGTRQAGGAVVSFSRILQDAPFGFIAIQNNITELIPTLQRLRQETGSTGGAFKAFFASLAGAGGVGLAISAITSALTLFSLSNRGAKKDTDEAKKSIDQAAEAEKAYSAAVDKAAASVVSQAGKLADLRSILVSTTNAFEDLTQATINQGLARFIFDQKNVEIQKILNNEIKKAIELRKIESPFAAVGEVKFQAPVISDKTKEAFKTLRVELPKTLTEVEKFNTGISQSQTEISKLDLLGKGLEPFFKLFIDKTPKAGKETDDFVSKMKALAKELENIGFVVPKFSFLDTAEEELAKAQKVFKDFSARKFTFNDAFFKKDIEIPITFPRPDSLQPEINTFQEGIQQGLIDAPPVEVPVGLSENIQQVARVISDFEAKFKAAGIVFKLPVEVNLEGTGSNASDILQKQLDRGIKLKGLEKRLQDIIGQFSADLFVGLGQAIGDAIGGATNVFDAIFKVLAAGMKQFGEALIALGTAKLALDKLFKGPQGAVLAIGAGIALIALSTIVSNFQGPKFAKGGLVTGPTLGLVGEGRGTSQSNPEVIAPLDKLKGMLADVGGGRQTVVVMGKIRGKDIALGQARTSKAQRRFGA